MASQLWRAAKAVARWIGYAAAYFADVPDFLEWLFGLGVAGAVAMSREPIGSMALAAAVGIMLALWRNRRGPPVL